MTGPSNGRVKDLTNREAVRWTGYEFAAACVMIAIACTLLYIRVDANADTNSEQAESIVRVQEAVIQIQRDVSILSREMEYNKEERARMWQLMDRVDKTLERLDKRTYHDSWEKQ